jgi:hypothetical protein
MGKAKSPATPNTLDIPIDLSLDKTCTITVVCAAFFGGADSRGVRFVDRGSAARVDTRDIVDA